LNVEIGFLADHSDLVSVIASWYYQEWGQIEPVFTPQCFELELCERLNRDRLPLTLVAFNDSIPVATASLKLKEMETHPEIQHWLGGVYTLPEYRRRGIGSQIVKHATTVARHLGVSVLYLYTRNSESLYAREGWVTIERPIYHERKVAIMKIEL